MRVKRSQFLLVSPVLALPRVAKRLFVLSVDLGLCVVTVWFAYYLRLDEFVALSGSALWAVVTSICLSLPVFVVSGLYRAIFRYSGWPALLAVARAVGVYGVLYASIFTAIGVPEVPRAIGIIQPILLLLFVGGSRAFARIWLGDEYLNILKQASRPKVVIYGAGSTGRQLVAAMANSHEMQVVGFLDDDDRLHGHVLDGQPIHSPADLATLATTLPIAAVLLAMPSISQGRRNEILNRLRAARLAVRTLPRISDLAHGRVSVADLRELDLDDLLGREPVMPNHLLLAMKIHDKTVLVTGAGGAIGGELCRQILAVGAARLLLVEQNERALRAVHRELEARRMGREIVFVPLLASVQDGERMHEIMSTWHPDTVYHAAAYTHVSMVEHNPAESVKNNVLGMLRTAQAAAENGVADFVFVSTEQAARPVNIMGASKRLAEVVLQSLAAISTATRYCIVRFGEVQDSSASVAARFREQIRNGGPITLTCPGGTRCFMTITEAAQLIIQAGAMARGGDVFALDMGPPVRIIDLIHRIVEFSGLSVKDESNPEGNVEIVVTGLCPAERLDGESLIGDNRKPTVHPRILRVPDEYLAWDELAAKLEVLEIALTINDVAVICRMLQQLVATYRPSDEIVDWVYLEQEAEARALGFVG